METRRTLYPIRVQRLQKLAAKLLEAIGAGNRSLASNATGRTDCRTVDDGCKAIRPQMNSKLLQATNAGEHVRFHRLPFCISRFNYTSHNDNIPVFLKAQRDLVRALLSS